MAQKLNFVVFVVSSNHFNRNAKVPSIAKIEIEIENDEDVTEPYHIKVFLQLQAPSYCLAYCK